MPISPWFFVILLSLILLGSAIAYGVLHNRGRTAADRALSERGTRKLYEREDRGA